MLGRLMRDILVTTRFKRDLKKARKRGKAMMLIDAVVGDLAAGRNLPGRMRVHRLSGDLEGLWECHIEPDWLLIWLEDTETLTLVRTGSHSDLFG